MEGKRAIAFYIISKLFKDNEKQLERGENSYNSGHVKKTNFIGNVDPVLVRGEVHASMKNKFYDVEISIDLKKGEVVSKHCSCPRGQSVCHHMASLLYSAHYNVSSTDIERSWGTAQSKSDDEVKTVEDIYGHNEPYTAIQDTNKLNKIQFKEMLGDTNVVGFSWLLKPEQNSAVTALTVSVEELIFSEEFIQSSNKLSLFTSKLLLSCEEIQMIAAATVGQNRNEAWLIARKHRLTASKFGRVLKACQRNKFPPSFYKSILEGYDFNHALAVQWGVSNENLAREKFKQITNLPVYETGLWLHECGYLGGSPDGLIEYNALLEIKCPYSMRNVKIKEHLQTHKYFFKYEDGAVVVDKNHEYYHQVQGQLHITRRTICYFFVWTTIDHELFSISRDDEWISNLDILKEFYCNNFLRKAFDIVL